MAKVAQKRASSGAKRKQSQAQVEPVTAAAKPERAARNFDAGRDGRRLRAIPSLPTAINTQIRRYGRTLVARSRWLAVNNPYASAAKAAFVSALVGAGIKPSSLETDTAAKKQIQELWLDWTDEADADNLTDFYGMQAIVAAEMFEAGECFVRLHRHSGFRLQLMPSEMLPTWHNEALPGGRRIECGIEFDGIGRRVAYHFLRNHPGESAPLMTANAERVRVPAEEILHLFRPIRAGQIRGIPHTLSGIITQAMLDLYDDAELERKRTAALFAAFVTRTGGNTEDDDPFAGTGDTAKPASTSDFTLEPGAVVDLLEGQNVAFSEPADVGTTYEAFQYRMLLRGAAGFGVPYAEMTGDLRQTSYGSIRAGLVAFRRRIEAMQHGVMVFQFCRPVWNAWFEAERLSASRRVKWIPPKWEWVDPLKDRQAEKLAVDSGFKPRSDVIEAEGFDPEEVDNRIAQDQKRASGLGIKFIQLPSSVIVAPDDEETIVAVSAAANTGDDFDFG